MVFLAGEILAARASSLQQLRILSEAIATNSTAALAFDNPEDARAVLAAFKSDPHIIAAALYKERRAAIRHVSGSGAFRRLARDGGAGGLQHRGCGAHRCRAGARGNTDARHVVRSIRLQRRIRSARVLRAGRGDRDRAGPVRGLGHLAAPANESCRRRFSSSPPPRGWSPTGTTTAYARVSPASTSSTISPTRSITCSCRPSRTKSA